MGNINIQLSKFSLVEQLGNSSKNLIFAIDGLASEFARKWGEFCLFLVERPLIGNPRLCRFADTIGTVFLVNVVDAFQCHFQMIVRTVGDDGIVELRLVEHDHAFSEL